MTNTNKKPYESPKLTAEGTIAGLTQSPLAISGGSPTTTAPLTTFPSM